MTNISPGKDQNAVWVGPNEPSGSAGFRNKPKRNANQQKHHKLRKLKSIYNILDCEKDLIIIGSSKNYRPVFTLYYYRIIEKSPSSVYSVLLHH